MQRATKYSSDEEEGDEDEDEEEERHGATELKTTNVDMDGPTRYEMEQVAEGEFNLSEDESMDLHMGMVLFTGPVFQLCVLSASNIMPKSPRLCLEL